MLSAKSVKLIITAIVIAGSLSFFYAYAEEAKGSSAAAAVDETKYVKDTLPVENVYACQIGYRSACEVPVLLDGATKRVEYYWSAIKNGWLAAGNEQAALQTLYDKREEIRTQQRLKQMQDEMDKRNRESMREGQENTPIRR